MPINPVYPNTITHDDVKQKVDALISAVNVLEGQTITREVALNLATSTTLSFTFQVDATRDGNHGIFRTRVQAVVVTAGGAVDICSADVTFYHGRRIGSGTASSRAVITNKSDGAGGTTVSNATINISGVTGIHTVTCGIILTHPTPLDAVNSVAIATGVLTGRGASSLASGAGSTTQQYYRWLCTEWNDAGDIQMEMAELELMETVGGADVTTPSTPIITGGTLLYSSSVTALLDNSNSTTVSWDTRVGVRDAIITLAAPTTIRQIGVTATPSAYAAPKAFELFSGPGTSGPWTSTGIVGTNQTGWTASQRRLFS